MSGMKKVNDFLLRMQRKGIYNRNELESGEYFTNDFIIGIYWKGIRYTN